MRRRLGPICAFSRLLPLAILLAAGVAAAQPKICGNQAALGDWTIGSCPTMKDDGIAPDETAGDGIYSVAVQLQATSLLEYKLLPTGSWDGGIEVREAATCPADGGSKANDTYNIQVVQPDVSQKAQFFFDSRTLADSSYSPAPSNRSGGDSLQIASPAGSCPSFVAVGDFQNLVGPNATAAPLVVQNGVLVGRITASKALTAGWGWKVVQKTSGVAREYGPSGWAYSPCTTAYATVSTPVSVGDSVYFLFHAKTGRLQTLVSGSPLDGFAPDGAGSCQPAADMSTPRDLSVPPVVDDLATPPIPDMPSANADMATMTPGRPGIHCDCRIGAARAQQGSALPQLFLTGMALLLLRRRRAASALQRQRAGVKGD